MSLASASRGGICEKMNAVAAIKKTIPARKAILRGCAALTVAKFNRTWSMPG